MVPLLSPSAAAEPFTVELRPEESWLYVVVRYDRRKWSAVGAHDHVARASTFSGRVTWDPADLPACDVWISFPVTALEIDPPGARQRAALDPGGAVGDDDRRTIVRNMLSEQVLDATRAPTISYRSVSCAARADGNVEVTGDLSVHGVTNRVTTAMAVRAEPGTFAARGSLVVTHRDFGMEPFTTSVGGIGLPGAPRNAEELELVIDVVGGAPPAPVP